VERVQAQYRLKLLQVAQLQARREEVGQDSE